MPQAENLKKSGLKMTLPRMKILDLFESSSERHLSAEEVYRQLLQSGEEIGLATVYRVLTQFEQAGLLVRQHFDNGKSVFELNQGEHHDHIVCLQCGHVAEFYDAEIEARQAQQAAASGFAIQGHVLHIYANCLKENCPHRQPDEAD